MVLKLNLPCIKRLSNWSKFKLSENWSTSTKGSGNNSAHHFYALMFYVSCCVMKLGGGHKIRIFSIMDITHERLESLN